MSSIETATLKNSQKGERKISLHHYFAWYENAFCKKLSKAASEFLAHEVKFKLAGLSNTPNTIWNDGDYFVSQLGIFREYSVTVKVSDTAASFIFRNALGDKPKETGYLKLKSITELEASILTSLNEFLLKKIQPNFLTPVEIKSIEHKIENLEKSVFLTFYIYNSGSIEAGKIMFIFPEFIIRNPIAVESPEMALSIDYFNPCLVDASIIAGYSRLTLDDVKNLDVEDIVILEKSNVYSMILKNHENMNININPNPSLVINLEEENGEITVNKTTGNIWDSLEVDLSAEFDKVKIRLGDLRQIIEGLVIDVAPIAQNKIFLNVEGKQIAAGELVIVGDNYGVKVTEVYSDAKPTAPQAMQPINTPPNHTSMEQPQQAEDEEIDDSDFDFSDYEIEEDV